MSDALPSDARERALARGRERVVALRDEIEHHGGALSAAEMAARLGLTPEEVEARAAAKRLLWFPEGEVRLYPAVQLGPRGLLWGVEALGEALPIDNPWVRLDWFLTSDDRLGGETPLEALRRGETDLVIRAALGYGGMGG
jgi:hypothetical protein